MNTELALCDAIRANPEEDTPRLMYADFLDDVGTVSVGCVACGGLGGRLDGYGKNAWVPCGCNSAVHADYKVPA